MYVYCKKSEDELSENWLQYVLHIYTVYFSIIH